MFRGRLDFLGRLRPGVRGGGEKRDAEGGSGGHRHGSFENSEHRRPPVFAPAPPDHCRYNGTTRKRVARDAATPRLREETKLNRLRA